MGDNKTLAAVLVIFGAIFALPIFMIASSALNGWVLMHLWEWFMVSIFHLPAITIWQAVGVSTTIGFLTHQMQTGKDPRGFGTIISTAILTQFLTLGFGWVIHTWMLK